MDEFYNVSMRKKLNVNAGKSKVMVFESRKAEIMNCNTPIG